MQQAPEAARTGRVLNVIEALALNTLLPQSPDHPLGRRDPRAVPRILRGPPRRGGRSCRDRRVQRIDRPHPLPTPPATRGLDAASAHEAKKAMEDGPHGLKDCLQRTLKLLLMFGNQSTRTALDPTERHLLNGRLPLEYGFILK